MNPFVNIQKFVNSITTDMTNLALSIAVLGFLFCAVMIFRGSEENVPRFQKAAFWTGGSVVIIVLSKVIVSWIRTGVA
ncbi:MAG: TrbC/VirB2 family protein [Carnobacterium alterfunditum]